MLIRTNNQLAVKLTVDILITTPNITPFNLPMINRIMPVRHDRQ